MLYTYITLIGVFAFILNNAATNFKGSSIVFNNVLAIFSLLGFLSYFALIVTSFFYIEWWKPLLMLFGIGIASSMSKELHQYIIIVCFALVGVVVCNYLSWVTLLS